MSNKLELLSGPAVEAAIKEANATSYTYVLNHAGLYMALGLAVVFYGLGVFCYFATGLSSPFAMIAFVTLMLVGVALTAVAAYWHQFATEQKVAVSDDRLFVGGPKATWVIAWDLLDPQAMGFGELQMTRLRGALRMQVGGQTIKLHLFNVFAYLGELEAFMHGVLTNLNIATDDPADELAIDEEE